MTDANDRAFAAPPAIDYARPDAGGPRPGATIWIASALVMAAVVILALAGLVAAVYGRGDERVGAIVALAIAAGVARLEWGAVFRRSDGAAWSIAGLVGLAAAPMLAFAVVCGVEIVRPGVWPRADVLFNFVALASAAAALGFVTVAHALWAQRVRRARMAKLVDQWATERATSIERGPSGGR